LILLIRKDRNYIDPLLHFAPADEIPRRKRQPGHAADLAVVFAVIVSDAWQADASAGDDFGKVVAASQS
jgi:hypothetical protein